MLGTNLRGVVFLRPTIFAFEYERVARHRLVKTTELARLLSKARLMKDR